MPKMPVKIAALHDRPLIWLLPFYLAGISRGWTEVGDPAQTLKAALGLALAAALARSLNFKYPRLILVPAVFALGWGLTLQSLRPPDSPTHLLNLVPENAAADPVVLGGQVLELTEGRNGQNLILEAREIIRPGPDGPAAAEEVHGLVRLSLGGRLTEVGPGDYLRLPVSLRRLRSFKNPGLEDRERLWAARGVRVSGFVKSPRLVSSWPGRPGSLDQLRRAGRELIRSRAPEPAAGLLAAQLLGDRGAVEKNSEEVFQRLGLSHILAISGLHLGLWFGLCFWVFRRMLRPVKFLRERGAAGAAAALLAVGPALFYAALAGPAAPVRRAGLMILALTLAGRARRRSVPWHILAGAAWAILLLEPYRLFTVSFQLSFAATAAMLAVFIPRPDAEKSPPPAPRFWNRSLDLQRRPAPGRLKEKFRRPVFLINTFKAALAGSLGTAPLVAHHFGFLPLAGIPANLVFTPILSFFALLPGLLALALLPLWPGLAGSLMSLAGGVLTGLGPLMEKLAEAAGPGLLLATPGPWFLLAWYGAGWLFCRGEGPPGRRLRRAGLVLILGLWPGLLAGPAPTGLMRLTFLDVGQGLAIHASLPDGRQMLVDGGGGYNFDPGDFIIRPYLLRQGLTRLDVAALTHPDHDHLTGLITAVRDFQPREIWRAPWPADQSPLMERLESASPASARPDWEELRRPRDFGPARMELLWPEFDRWPEKGRTNDLSLVWRLAWGEASFLITGDIGPEVEKALIERHGQTLRSSVLLAPHHGSRTGLSPEFLAAVRPRWVVISAGRNNPYGLPAPETLARARAAGAEIWRTDLDGAAVFEARPGSNGVKIELKNNKR
ncbi:MAG: DNA internalization-related competence protein ComEC/Rec2 [Candidatus Adiutrix sp.]|jgi:competence protein ComEC|nr:DNA internalization-related competence protein ComEC/Rec2 [Candidatus Adiutrix sp.]